MKLPPQSTGIEITQANKKIAEAKSLYPAEFLMISDTSVETKPWQPSNFRVTIGDLDNSDCCLICKPSCHCCYAFSRFVLRT
jgi:hypothetical protein